MGKSGNVSLISGIHMVGKKGLLTQIVVCPLHTKKKKIKKKVKELRFSYIHENV